MLCKDFQDTLSVGDKGFSGTSRSVLVTRILGHNPLVCKDFQDTLSVSVKGFSGNFRSVLVTRILGHYPLVCKNVQLASRSRQNIFKTLHSIHSWESIFEGFYPFLRWCFCFVCWFYLINNNGHCTYHSFRCFILFLFLHCCLNWESNCFYYVVYSMLCIRL